MGSHMNFKSFGDASQGELKPQGNNPLVRQPSSIFSLTFDELQNSWSGLGKDYGSMNIDELLKSIGTAEELQAMTSAAAAAAAGGGGGGEGNFTGGNLQRQGSLTLPRTLSQKTVDEVWRDLIKETSGGGGGGNGGSGGGGGGVGSNMPQRQQTLGEMTLEEFLVRAGVVREDNSQQVGARPNNGAFYMANNMNNNNNSLAMGFQQQQTIRNNDIMANRVIENNNPVQIPPQRPPQHQLQQQQQPLFPKQTTLAFGPSVSLLGPSQLTSHGARNSAVNVTNPSAQSGGTGMVGLGTGSPANQVSPDVIGKSSGDVSPLSPVPYVFGRGRKCAALEKVVERRHRRMIKNRESAARSRARKQAYTLELEAEVAKLKEMNQELQRKQAETLEMQKNQILETMKIHWGGKKQCLRRTLTGPW